MSISIIWRFLAGTLTCFAFALTGAAQTGVSILPSDPMTSYSSYGLGSIQRVAVTDPGVPFTQALQITINKAGTAPWSAAVNWNTTGNAAKGDLVLLTFWVKNDNPDLSVLRIAPAFQINDATLNYRKALYSNAPSDTGQWVRYGIPFFADADYPAAGPGSSLQFFCGSAAQMFEIGGITLLDYGPVPSPFPSEISNQFAFYYPGRYGPAAWKQQAQQNIERYRMADVRVVVTSNGKPVANASVSLKQTRSDFGWARPWMHAHS